MSSSQLNWRSVMAYQCWRKGRSSTNDRFRRCGFLRTCLSCCSTTVLVSTERAVQTNEMFPLYNETFLSLHDAIF